MEKVITRFHFSPLGLWLYGFVKRKQVREQEGFDVKRKQVREQEVYDVSTKKPANLPKKNMQDGKKG